MYDLDRLCRAIRQARLALEHPRASLVRMVRAQAGPEWSSETSSDASRPVNLIELYKKIVLPNLISQNPRVLLSTFNAGGKPAVAAMQSWLNLELGRMGFCETMQRVVDNALNLVGITKVALATPDDAAEYSWGLRAGQPFVEPVEFDDFVYDIHARKFAEASFIGHRLRRPLDVVQNSKVYNRKAAKKLQASKHRFYNQEGDLKIDVLGRGFWGGDTEDFEDMVDLWEIYLPRHRVVITLPSDDGGNPEMGMHEEPLREQNWLGPDDGPYHFLGFETITGNALPKGPVQTLYKLDEVVNHLYRKLINQAQRQKEILAVQGAADADGSRIVQAPDGEAIRVDNPEAAQVMSFGAPNAMNFQFADHLKQLFSYMACNLDAAGGLSPQAKTLGQDKMIQASSSRVIMDMQARTAAYVARVVKAVSWYHWKHPENELTYEHTLKGMAKGRTRTVYPAGARDQNGVPRTLTRSVPFEQLDLRVDPYSLAPQDPATRLQTMNGVVTQIVIPMMQLLQAQGIGFDMNAYLEKVGTYSDMPDLADILTIQEPPAQTPSGPSHNGPAMPQNTERRYVRENVAMRSEKGASQQLMASLSGVKTGGAQRNGQPAGVG